jgi:transposase
MDFSLDNKQRRKIEELLRSNISGKVQKRLFALLWLDDSKVMHEVAGLLHVSQRCLRDWLRIFRNKGFDALLVLHYKGDIGDLTASQIDQLKEEVATGKFHCARQVQKYLLETFQRDYSLSGTKRLLHRIGCSFHQVSGFLFKADRDKQQEFVANYHADAAQAGKKNDATSLTPAIRFGVWKPFSVAGSCAASVWTSA